MYRHNNFIICTRRIIDRGISFLTCTFHSALSLQVHLHVHQGTTTSTSTCTHIYISLVPCFLFYPSYIYLYISLHLSLHLLVSCIQKQIAKIHQYLSKIYNPDLPNETIEPVKPNNLITLIKLINRNRIDLINPNKPNSN